MSTRTGDGGPSQRESGPVSTISGRAAGPGGESVEIAAAPHLAPSNESTSPRTSPADADAPDAGPLPDLSVESGIRNSQARVDLRAVGPVGLLRARGWRWLHLADALLIYSTMVVYAYIRYQDSWPTYPKSHYFVGFAIATFIYLAVLDFMGLYEREPRLGYRAIFPPVFSASAISIVLIALAGFLSDRYLMPRRNMAVLGVVGVISLTAVRHIARRVRIRNYGRPRVLLVGDPPDVARATAHLTDSDEYAQLAGSVDTTEHLGDSVATSRATDVLLLGPHALDEVYPNPLVGFQNRGIGVFQRVSAQDTLLGLKAVRQVAGMPFTAIRSHGLAPHQLRLKRAFEGLVLGVVAPPALLLGFVLTLYVRLLAGPGVLFTQTRLGLHGTHFEMMKFRTMRLDAESATGAVKAGRRDERIVRGLGWLRSTRLDELPQLLHVLRGTMSLIGPRPERPELAEGYADTIPGYERRNTIPPGITGLAQVLAGYHTDPDYKLSHDIQYIVNWSPGLDAIILVRTVAVMLRRTL